MGHVVGLAHENQRAETPCHQYDEPMDGQEIAVVRRFDHASIMNKCNYRPLMGLQSFRLSKGDIDTLKLIYGYANVRLENRLTDCKPGYTYFPKHRRCLISQDGTGGCPSGEVIDDGTQTCKPF